MMSRKFSSLIFCAVSAAVLSLLFGCSSLPKDTEIESWKIEDISGPEDIVADQNNGAARLLVSSSDRRDRGIPGEIYTVDCSTMEKKILPRKGGPQGNAFNPHGLSLTVDESESVLLYVINHSPGKEGEDRVHSILIYSVEPDALVLDETLTSPLLTSPNDLFALPDGTVYVSNDSSAKGGLMELILGLKRSTVVRFDPRSGEWSVAIDKLAMANGIYIEDDYLYLAVTRENAVYRYPVLPDGSLGERLKLADVKSVDNITPYGDYLLVAGHPKDMAFMNHMRDSSNPSPSLIFRIPKMSPGSEVIFSDSGETISAASVGVVCGSRLFIGQVADDFVIAVPASVVER